MRLDTTYWARAIGLFALAAGLRWSFAHASGEAGSLATAAYEGDAPKWLDYARAADSNPLAELPLDPPAMPWLVDLLTDGSDLTLARWVLLLTGALVAPLVYTAARADLGERVGLLAGLVCAGATNLILVSAGLHAEPPFLVLALLGVQALLRLRRGAGGWATAAWFGCTQAAACLFRVDHLMFVVLGLAWLLLRSDCRRAALIAAAALVACLGPFQADAWSRTQQVNERGLRGNPPATLPLPDALPWSEDALARVRAMPAFARTMGFVFVDQTVRLRGGSSVEAVDLGVLEEAYGAGGAPQPLPPPLLALYGPLNFALANHPDADGGFSRAALDARPPLHGGLQSYPPWLAPVLQPNGPLRLDYPPHLDLVNAGYARGLGWIAADPAGALQRCVEKLRRTLNGAATGIGGYAAPLGLSGTRHPVDLVEPRSPLLGAWRTASVALAVAGLLVARRRRQLGYLAPWLMLAASKLAPAIAFFGYARFGALLIPALAVTWAMAADILIARLTPRSRRILLAVIVMGLCGGEFVRLRSSPAPRLVNGAGRDYAQGRSPGRNEAVDVIYESPDASGTSPSGR